MNNIKQLALILVLLCAPAMWGATYACLHDTTRDAVSHDFNTNGAWTTCNGSHPQAPGTDTYTFTINSSTSVTCTGACAAGTSAGASGECVNNGTFTVAAGSTMDCYGEYDVGHGAILNINSTCGNIGTLQIDVPTATTYKLSFTVTGSGTAQLNMTGAAPSGARCDAIIKCNPTGTGVCTLTGVSGGTNPTQTLSYAQIQNFGSPTVGSLNMPSYAFGGLSWHNVLLLNPGLITLTANNATANWDWNGVTIINPLDTSVGKIGILTGGIAPTTSTRTFFNVVAYSSKGLAAGGPYLLDQQVLNATVGNSKRAGDAANVTGFVGYNSVLTEVAAYSANQSVRNSLLINDSSPSAGGVSCVLFAANANQTLYDTMCLGVVPNFHVMSGGSSSQGLAQNVFVHAACDGDGTAQNDWGDMINNGFTWTAYGQLDLNNCGTLITSSGASQNVNILNSVAYRAQGAAICESGPCSATAIAGFRNNIGVWPNSYLNVGTTNAPGLDLLHLKGAYITRQSWGANTMRNNVYFMMPNSGDTLNGNNADVLTGANAGVGFLNGYFVPNNTTNYITGLNAKTLTSGTTTTHVSCSGCNFITAGVQQGDFVQDTTLSQPWINGIVGANITATDFDLISAVTGLKSGDTFSVFPSLYSSASLYFGDANNQQQTFHVSPAWRDPDHATTCYWFTHNGGTAHCGTSGDYLATASTGTSDIYCSSCDFVTWNVQVGEPVVVYATSSLTTRGYSTVASVATLHHITLTTPITGLAANDQFAFLDVTQGVGRAMVQANGFDYTGAYAAVPSWTTVANLNSYLDNALTPMNGMLKNAAYSGDCATLLTVLGHCDVGPVQSYPPAILSNN